MHTGHPLIVGEFYLSRKVVEMADQAAEYYAVARRDIGTHGVKDMLGEVGIKAGVPVGSHFEVCVEGCVQGLRYNEEDGEKDVEGSGCEAGVGSYIPSGSCRAWEPKQARAVHFPETSFAGRVSDNSTPESPEKRIRRKPIPKCEKHEETRADSNTGTEGDVCPAWP